MRHAGHCAARCRRPWTTLPAMARYFDVHPDNNPQARSIGQVVDILHAAAG